MKGKSKKTIRKKTTKRIAKKKIVKTKRESTKNNNPKIENSILKLENKELKRVTKKHRGNIEKAIVAIQAAAWYDGVVYAEEVINILKIIMKKSS